MIRFPAALFAIAAALLPVTAGADTSALSPAQVQAVQKLIHDYLLDNPKVMVEALAKAEEVAKAEEASQAKAAIAANAQALYSDAASPVIGNPAGSITLVEFFDYRCPYCKSTAPVLRAMIEKDSRIRLVMKEFPILSPESEFAARVALVAAKHGKYTPFHWAMFALKGGLTDDATMAVAHDIGLDPDAVAREMRAPDITRELDDNRKLARALGVDGTPSFVIGDELSQGAVTPDDLAALIAAHQKG